MDSCNISRLGVQSSTRTLFHNAILFTETSKKIGRHTKEQYDHKVAMHKNN